MNRFPVSIDYSPVLDYVQNSSDVANFFYSHKVGTEQSEFDID